MQSGIESANIRIRDRDEKNARNTIIDDVN